MRSQNDIFNDGVIEASKLRASFICSNPDCRSLTLYPSERDSKRVEYIGEVSHITAKAPGGPRFDPSSSSQERCSINNAIFLCRNCASRIDKNQGLDYPVEMLHRWRSEHERWIRDHLNKSTESPINRITNSIILTRGSGIVTGARIETPTLMDNIRITAEGDGAEEVTGLHVKATTGDNHE